MLALGFGGLALWRLTEAIAGRGDIGDRVKAAAKIVIVCGPRLVLGLWLLTLVAPGLA